MSLRGVRPSGGLQEFSERCQHQLWRIWGSAVIVAAIASLAGWLFDLRSPTEPLSWPLALSLVLAAGISPHLMVWHALRPHRIGALTGQSVEPATFPEGGIISRRILSQPFEVHIHRRSLLTREDVEGLSEQERRLIPAVRAVLNWSIVRLCAVLFAGGLLVIFLGPSALNTSRAVLTAGWALLIASCIPRVNAWTSRISTP